MMSVGRPNVIVNNKEKFEKIIPLLSEMICIQHDSPYLAYCLDCHLMVCMNCQIYHENHVLKKLKSIYEVAMNSYGCEPDIGDKISGSAKSFLTLEHEYEERLNKLEIEILLDKSILNDVEAVIDDETRTMENELRVMRETIYFIRKEQFEAKTLVLKKNFQYLVEMIDKIGLQDITDELKGNISRREKVKAKILSNVWLYNYLHQKHMLLSYLVTLDGDDNSGHPVFRSTLTFLQYIYEKYYQEDLAVGVEDIESFISFPNIVEVPEIRMVNTLPLQETKNGVMVTNPVAISGIKRREGGGNVSISHTGLLAIVKKKLPIYIYNLVNGEETTLESLNGSGCMGFYDENVVLVENMKKMKETSLNILLSKKTINCMEEISVTEPVYKCCDISSLNTTRELIYSNWNGNAIHVYNIDQKIQKSYEYPSQMHASFTGIKVKGVTSLFLDEKNTLCRMNIEHDEINVTKLKRNFKIFDLGIVLPSISKPADLDKAAIFIDGEFVGDGEKTDEETSGKFIMGSKGETNIYNSSEMFSCDYAICRAQGNTFVVFDTKKHRWSFMKIIIP